MKTKILITLVLIATTTVNSWAHALWIETASVGKKGQKQEVKVYFGEYLAKEITPVAEWFSDLKDFSLILLTPDGNQVELDLVAKDNYFLTDFTPKAAGQYKVLLKHTAKDVYYGYKLDYNSSALIKVGDGETFVAENINPLVLTPTIGAGFSVKTPVKINVFAHENVKGDKSVEVHAPNGWIKKVYPDEKGNVSFTPLWPGKYLVEMIIENKTKGTHNGEEFKVDFQCATYMLMVE